MACVTELPLEKARAWGRFSVRVRSSLERVCGVSWPSGSSSEAISVSKARRFGLSARVYSKPWGGGGKGRGRVTEVQQWDFNSAVRTQSRERGASPPLPSPPFPNSPSTHLVHSDRILLVGRAEADRGDDGVGLCAGLATLVDEAGREVVLAAAVVAAAVGIPAETVAVLLLLLLRLEDGGRTVGRDLDGVAAVRAFLWVEEGGG